ncbi:hypothetical protein [Streptomyces albipurpureus]|nr:hypothetical protein [Streptomyces sp. CWNU-1]
MPTHTDLTDYGHALSTTPLLLALGAPAGLFIKDTATAPRG